MIEKRVRVSARGLIIENGRLLVVRYEDDRGPWYVVPGGGQRHGEDLVETVGREVEEETGYRVQSVGPLRFVREFIGATGEHNKLAHIHGVEIFFECILEPGAKCPSAGREPDDDQMGVEWLAINQLDAVIFYPNALIPNLPQNGSAWSNSPVYLGAAK